MDYENLTINIWNDDPDSTLTEADVASYFVRHPYTYEKRKKIWAMQKHLSILPCRQMEILWLIVIRMISG